MESVIMVTMGVISTLWSIVNLVVLWGLLNSFEVQFMKKKIDLKDRFFFPFAGLIFFVVWLIL